MDICPACGESFSRPRGTGIPYTCPRCGERILAALGPDTVLKAGEAGCSTSGAADEMFDATCPRCRTVHHVRARSIGAKLRCNECGRPFTIEPLDAAVVDADVTDGGPIDLGTFDAEVVDAGVFGEDATPTEYGEGVGDEVVEAEAYRVDAGTGAASPAGLSDEGEFVPTLPAEAMVMPLAATAAAAAALSATPTTGPRTEDEKAFTGATWPARELPATPAARPEADGRKKARGSTLWKGGLILAPLLVGLLAFFVWYKPPDPEERWAVIQNDFKTGRWKEAQAGFEQFPTDFPESPRVAEVPFFLDLVDASPHIRAKKADLKVGLEKAQALFQKYRDQPAYNSYCFDLYVTMAVLCEGLVNQAVKNTDLDGLARAREALELLQTVGAEAAKKDDRFINRRSSELVQGIDKADRDIQRTLARARDLVALQQAQSTEPDVQADELYALDEALAGQFPELAEDKELIALRNSAYLAEAARVRYLPEDFTGQEAAAPAAAVDPNDSTLFPVWDEAPDRKPPSTSGEVVMSVARGVFYVFDPTGELLWARRLGADSHRLPVRIVASTVSPALLVAVSTDDNSLVALDAESGRVRWRFPAGDRRDLIAPLTLLGATGGGRGGQRRGLLPTAEGEIHVLELVLGRRIGRFEVGHPLTAGGTFDLATGLVFFPADEKRLFAIDPAAIDSPGTPACRGVLFTNHPNGALLAPPAVVDDYLVLAESSSLEQMRVRAFRIQGERAFPDPHAPALKELPLAGWSWFAPCATPDRIAVITDEGVLGVFGLNLDNADEALYPLIADAQGNCPRLPLPLADAFRPLAIQSDEHLLWVMAGGRLWKLGLDILNQQVRPLWPKGDQPGEVLGVPVHEAQTDRLGSTFYLTTMSAQGDGFRCTAVDADQGTRRWHWQLGIDLAGDPIAQDGRALLVDRSARVAELTSSTADAPNGGPRLARLTDPRIPPPEVAGGGVLRLATFAGDTFLAMASGDGRQLALRRLDLKSPGDEGWTLLPLPGVMQGRPALCGRSLVVPCGDGRLHRVELGDPGVPAAGGMANELLFTWARTDVPLADQTVDVWPLGDDAILLVEDDRRVRRLQFREKEGVRLWEQVGETFEAPAGLVGPPLVVGERVVLADRVGLVVSLAANDLGHERLRWQIEGEPTGGPFLRAGRAMVVVDGRRLASLVLDPAADTSQRDWTAGPFDGPVRGQPTEAGEFLLVADGSGSISALDMASGKPAAKKVILGGSLAPTAAAVSFGTDRMLVPLADGTLLVLPLPQPDRQEIAEARP